MILFPLYPHATVCKGAQICWTMDSELRRKMEIIEILALGEEINPRGLFIHIDLGDRYQVMWPFKPDDLLEGKQSSCSVICSLGCLPPGMLISTVSYAIANWPRASDRSWPCPVTSNLLDVSLAAGQPQSHQSCHRLAENWLHAAGGYLLGFLLDHLQSTKGSACITRVNRQLLKIWIQGWSFGLAVKRQVGSQHSMA